MSDERDGVLQTASSRSHGFWRLPSILAPGSRWIDARQFGVSRRNGRCHCRLLLVNSGREVDRSVSLVVGVAATTLDVELLAHGGSLD